MRLNALPSLITAVLLTLGCSGSNSRPSDVGTGLGLITAHDLAGTYTGVLEGITVPSLDVLPDTTKHSVLTVDLLHSVTATDKGGLNLLLESSVIPKTQAFILGAGPVAINLRFIDFEGLTAFPADHVNHFLQVKNLVFVQCNGEWILVAQIARVGFPADTNLNGVYVYQFVAYPKSLAQPMSQNDAIQYVNTILKQVGSAG